MREHSRIVCSGYGWKDESFNAMLKDWSDYHDNPRMLLLHAPSQMHEFEGRHKPWPWPEKWIEEGESSWLCSHQKWLSEMDFQTLAACRTFTATKGEDAEFNRYARKICRC